MGQEGFLLPRERVSSWFRQWDQAGAGSWWACKGLQPTSGTVSRRAFEEGCGAVGSRADLEPGERGAELDIERE